MSLITTAFVLSKLLLIESAAGLTFVRLALLGGFTALACSLDLNLGTNGATIAPALLGSAGGLALGVEQRWPISTTGVIGAPMVGGLGNHEVGRRL